MDRVEMGDYVNGLLAQENSYSMGVCVWEDDDTTIYYLDKDEAISLRDALDRWINEGGK